MTQAEYYAILKERWEEVDKDDRNSIHAYNEFKRQLRHCLDTDEQE